MRSLISPSAVFYGDVRVGDGSVVEDGVVIGHPGAAEVSAARAAGLGRWTDLAAFYQACAVRPTVVGAGATIRSGTVIYSGTHIGDGFDCGHNVLIREGVRIGDDVYVKSYTEIMKLVVIGQGCRVAGVIADRSLLGDEVSSFGVLTHAYEARYVPEMSERRGPTVKRGAFVGRGAVLIGAIVVGEDAVIGADTVINFDVPPRSFFVGTLGTAKARRARPKQR